MDDQNQGHKSHKTSSLNSILILIVVLSLFSLSLAGYYLNRTNNFILTTDFDIDKFKAFIIKYDKSYKTTDDYIARFKIFKENLLKIQNHNDMKKSWSFGITKFADLTQEEFINNHIPANYIVATQSYVAKFEGKTEIKSIDWEKNGAVTSIVKDQEGCIGSWAISVAEATSAYYFINHGSLIEASSQELIDCSGDYNNNGCSGGYAVNAFKYVKENGLSSAENYPFVGIDQECKANEQKLIMANAIYQNSVQSNNVSELIQAVSQQPVLALVDSKSWQFYKSGIITDDCGANLNHVVIITGFDTTQEKPYWIIKNSWGYDWGENGFGKIGISEGSGICGINMDPSFPVML
ncbi:unnamed protein product [Blepharisma stoltei]|uniref:Papain family cysteine protease n=1 Tax=Blepharisma stoltei TaxID=1481888 RepID=A0AAU9JP64_9CILI|nr:unnamed protein product [Blepharisma stoltei]